MLAVQAVQAVQAAGACGSAMRSMTRHHGIGLAYPVFAYRRTVLTTAKAACVA